MGGVLGFLRSRELYYSMARYALAALMMSFGMLKIIGMQFNTIRPFATWAQPLEHLSGQQLTWAFLGHSESFQVFIGLFEFIPASLLLFRKTALAGALLLLPMTIGVFMVNFQMNLWTNTKLDATFMLAANVLIILLDGKRVRSLLTIAIGSNKITGIEVAIAIGVTSIAVMPRLLSNHYKDDNNQLTGDWFQKGVYVYELVREEVGERVLPRHKVRIFFGPNREYSEVNDSLSKSGAYKEYRVDEATGTIVISEQEHGPWRGSYYTLNGTLQYSLYGDTLNVANQRRHKWIFVRHRVEPYKY